MGIILDVKPMGKPRMTRRDVWKKRPCVVRYHQFADRLRFEAEKANVVLFPGISATFMVEMPKSWSKRKQEEKILTPCLQKPDLDNIIKGFLDVLCKEDKILWSFGPMQKLWGRKGAIVLHNNYEILEDRAKDIHQSQQGDF